MRALYGILAAGALAMNIDVLPTIADIVGLAPAAAVVDGRSLLPVFRGADESPHDSLYYFDNERVVGLRSQNWKYVTHVYYLGSLGAFERFNSSLPRYDVLTALALSPNGMTMGELASSLMVTKGNITGVVKRLKQDGLVRKVTSESDRRIQSVTLSTEGRALWDAMHADYGETISEILSGQSGEELDALTEMLENTRIAVQTKTRASGY